MTRMTAVGVQCPRLRCIQGATQLKQTTAEQQQKLVAARLTCLCSLVGQMASPATQNRSAHLGPAAGASPPCGAPAPAAHHSQQLHMCMSAHAYSKLAVCCSLSMMIHMEMSHVLLASRAVGAADMAGCKSEATADFSSLVDAACLTCCCIPQRALAPAERQAASTVGTTRSLMVPEIAQSK